MSWSDKQTLTFISMYRDRPLLWDPTNDGYKNRNKRQDALNELAEAFCMEKIEIEKKIKGLQSQFARERKKEKESLESGCMRDEVYGSKWFAYKFLLFLVKIKKSKITANETPTTTTTDPEILVKQEIINENDAELDEHDNQIEQNERERPRRISLRKKQHKKFASSNKSRIFKAKPKQISYPADVAMPVLIETLNSIKSNQVKKEKEKDEYSLFGEQVAVRLRKIPSAKARFVIQNIIHKALFDGEMGMHNSPKTFYGNTPASSTLVNDNSFRTHNTITRQTTVSASQSLSGSQSPNSQFSSPSNDNLETMVEIEDIKFSL